MTRAARFLLVLAAGAVAPGGCSCDGDGGLDDPSTFDPFTPAGAGGAGQPAEVESTPAGAGGCAGPGAPDGACAPDATCTNAMFLPGVRYPAGDAPGKLDAGDLDGDGDRDLIVGSAAGVRILLGDGAGGLAASTTFATPSVLMARLADLDADSDPDLYVTAAGAILAYLNDGAAAFTTSWSLSGVYNGDAGAFDFDNDGVVDLVGSSRNFYKGVGDGTFVAPVNAFEASQYLTLADLNDDTELDLVREWTDAGNGRHLDLQLSDGDGTFTAPNAGGYSFPPKLDPPAVGDFDGDGAPDVATTWEQGLILLAGTSPGLVMLKVNHDLDTAIPAALLVDYTDDGRADLVYAVISGTTFVVRLYAGNAAFTIGDAVDIPVPSGLLGAVGYPSDLLDVDLDGDGALDLVASDRDDDSIIVWMRATRPGCATPPRPFETPTEPDAPAGCRSGWFACADDGPCCPDGYVCAGATCVEISGPPERCGDGFCDLDQVCGDVDAGTCCPDGYDVGCGDVCCLSGASCDAPGVCGCPSGSFACGEVCCGDGAACVDGACVAPCDDPEFPTACADLCCAAGSACTAGACACSAEHPTTCGDVCCLDGAACDEGTCGCPTDRVACGAQCCGAGRICQDGACVAPGGGGGDCPGGGLRGSPRACVPIGNEPCMCNTTVTDTCIQPEDYPFGGLPASCMAEGETGCFHHGTGGSDPNGIIAPCCPGLTCQVAECGPGADLNGTCMP